MNTSKEKKEGRKEQGGGWGAGGSGNWVSLKEARSMNANGHGAGRAAQKLLLGEVAAPASEKEEGLCARTPNGAKLECTTQGVFSHALSFPSLLSLIY